MLTGRSTDSPRNPSAKNLAKDYDTFTRCVRQHSPHSKIAGPGSAFWPRIGEAVKPLSNISSTFLASLEEKIDIVDWHYTPSKVAARQ